MPLPSKRGSGRRPRTTAPLGSLVRALGADLDAACVETLARRIESALTRGEAAKLAGVAASTLGNHIALYRDEVARGVQPAERRGLRAFDTGRDLYILRVDLDAWRGRRAEG